MREVSEGFAQKVLNTAEDLLLRDVAHAKTQRSKETPKNAAALGAFAPLREKTSSYKTLFVQGWSVRTGTAVN
jgi:hypothetical protein